MSLDKIDGRPWDFAQSFSWYPKIFRKMKKQKEAVFISNANMIFLFFFDAVPFGLPLKGVNAKLTGSFANIRIIGLFEVLLRGLG